MIEPTSIAEVVGSLAASPRPVLCLDTCDFLDVVRGFAENGNLRSETFRQLVDILNEEPGRLQPVITSLVRNEWDQNVQAARDKASGHIQETEARVARILDSCDHAKLAAVPTPADLARLPLVQGLVDLAEELMNRAMILANDRSCIDKALERVIGKRRPSQNGNIKDSIHLEHYLELSRRLDEARYPEPRAFVSANRADFWDGSQPRPHRDLETEFQAANLLFFGKLEAALGRLGILLP